jgi:hypothetical protein
VVPKSVDGLPHFARLADELLVKRYRAVPNCLAATQVRDFEAVRLMDC